MKERPILFSGPMVRAILAGTKMQTRRVASHPLLQCLSFVVHCGDGWWGDENGEVQVLCPYGKPGDRLWVRESFQPLFVGGEEAAQSCYKTGRGYAASYPATDGRQEFIDADTDGMTDRVTPSIHMPRWASRILLEIVSVRVERLQDISEADALAEGITDHQLPVNPQDSERARTWFRGLWSTINGFESWQANPWVWVVEFRRVDR